MKYVKMNQHTPVNDGVYPSAAYPEVERGEWHAPKSGKVRTRIASDAECERYGIDKAVVRKARARKAAETRKARKAIAEERAAAAETFERLMETGEVLAW